MTSGTSTTIPKTKTGDGNKLLYSWLNRKVEQFIKTLETDLNRGITALDTILGQCMYFGMSFSRIGADFRGQMAPIFLKVISKQVEDGIKAASKQFQLEMENYTLINKISVRQSSAGSDLKEDAENVSPPDSLLDFRPLANYCNAILNLLNELRLCAPLAVATLLTKGLEVSLQAMAGIICSFYKQEQQAFTPNEKENFLRFCSCFAYDLIPYLQKCVHVLYPLQNLVTHLGVTPATLQKSGITYFNQSAIIKPVEHLLPVTKVAEVIIAAAPVAVAVEGQSEEKEEEVEEVEERVEG